MNRFDYDLFVIGGGSGGVRAARTAASRGARVALAEVGPMGGTCVNVGCIPKKLYSYASSYAGSFVTARDYGWDIDAAFNWQRLKSARAMEIGRLNDVYQSLLEGSGVAIITGRARLIDAHTVEVGARRWTAENVIVATGGRPFQPQVDGLENAVVSDQVFDLPEVPKRLLVVGGGYIACEFASIFNGLGSQVTQVFRRDWILNEFDVEMREFLVRQMAELGVGFRPRVEIQSIEKSRGALLVTSTTGERIEVDAVLYATGRIPNTAGLGLENVAVALDPLGRIRVDAEYRTSSRSIFAVGDVTASRQLTPVALAEAMSVVDLLYPDPLQPSRRTVDYEYLPTAVFTHPAVATCGYSEEQARQKGMRVSVFSSEFRSLRQTLSEKGERTFMKLVVDASSDRVVGLHMVGEDAPEIVQGFAVAMRAGASKSVFDSTIGIHPTVAEEFVTLRTARTASHEPASMLGPEE